MDKKKQSPQQLTLFRIVNLVLILAIAGISASLLSNYITTNHARSVDGTWTGIITDDYDDFIVYDYTVTIDMDDDDATFTGATFAQAQPEFRQIHAGSSFVGTIDGTVLTFKDVSIHDANTGWCRIRTTLEWTNHNGVEVLAGKWYGLDAVCEGLDGRIHLTKAG